ncbi:FecR family protein [Campylobacter gastrosuis]|uniref:FecR domain-containing protein n=1 Tax=Campylobacter gastrosuis TaxID=2974576 RepID=A0ABT7HPC5_9BACT|nr:FecR domain-containing protein [Campylobacter gastrosuis]MDL0088771.1 FecR domain-containing protein [Campylobacter gastrosuis]
MKRIGLILLFIANALFASVGSVSLLEGEATIKRADKILNVSLGTKVEKNDIIQTKQNSKVRIDFVDKTIVTIGKQSTLNIKDYYFSDTNPKAARTELSVTEGAFHAITGQIGKVNPNRFKIKTKNATIGIRGTEIYADQSKVICTQGMIFVQSPLGDMKDVAKGNFVATQAGKPLGKVVAVDSENLNSVLDSFNIAQTTPTATTSDKNSNSNDSQKSETNTQDDTQNKNQTTSNTNESQTNTASSSTATTQTTAKTTQATSSSVAQTTSVTSTINDSITSWGDWDSENKNSQIAQSQQATKNEISQKNKDEAEKKMQEQEEARKKADAEAKQKAQQEEEAKRKAEEAEKKAQKEKEELAKKQAEEEKARKEAEEKQKQKELAEAEAKKQAEELAKKKAEEEKARKEAEEKQRQKELAEAEAKRQAEELAKKQAEEAEAKRKAAEEAAKAEEARKKAEQEATEKARKEAEEAQRQKELAEAEARRQAEELAKKQAEEAEAKRKAEEIQRQKELAEAEAARKAEELAKKQAEEEKARKEAEEIQRQKELAEAEARRQAEELAKQQAAEEEAKRKAEEEAKKLEEAKKQAEDAKKQAEAAAIAYKNKAIHFMKLFEESNLQVLTTRMMNSPSKIELNFSGTFSNPRHLYDTTYKFTPSENNINFKFLLGRGGAGGLNQFTGDYKYKVTDDRGNNYSYGGNFAGSVTGRRHNGTDFYFNDVGTDKKGGMPVIQGGGYFDGVGGNREAHITKVKSGLGSQQVIIRDKNGQNQLNVQFEADLTGGQVTSK